MNTKRISHIGVLVHDADAATRKWTETFGLKKIDERRIDVEGIRSVFVSVGGTWDEMVIEIMEPLDKSNMDNALSVDPGDSPRWLVHPKDANGVMVESLAR